MINLLRDFKYSLEEDESLPIDELRDYYLVLSKNILHNNFIITEVIYEDQSILMMVIKKILVCSHPIRTKHLDTLAWDIIINTPKEIINYKNKEGNTAAHFTCQMESFSVGLLDLMKQNGMNFSLQNKKGETPLMLVANSSSLDDLKFIQGYTNDSMINVKDNINGFTALHRAVKSKNLRNIFFLLEQGSNILIKDNQGLTVLDWLEIPQFYNKCSSVFINELKKMLYNFSDNTKSKL